MTTRTRTTFRCVICQKVKATGELFSLQRCKECAARVATVPSLREPKAVDDLDLYSDDTICWEGDL